MKVLIEVTEEDIKNGEVAEPCGCPIALAMMKRGYVKPIVMPSEVGVGIGEDRVSLPLPDVATEFINRYDLSRPVQPFRFEFEDGRLG